MQNTAIPKSNRKMSVLIRVFLVIALIIFLLFVFNKCLVRDVNVRDILLKRPNMTFSSSEFLVQMESTEYFVELDKSIKACFYQEKYLSSYMIPDINNIIISLQENDYLLIVLPADDINKKHNLLTLIFHLKESEYSYPLAYWYSEIKGDYHSSHYIYQEEDRVARDIVQSYARAFTQMVNGGEILFFGAGTSKNMTGFTIMGLMPTEVLCFKYHDNDYYLWYYYGATPFARLLEDKIDIYNGYTLGEVIDVFEIQFQE